MYLFVTARRSCLQCGDKFLHRSQLMRPRCERTRLSAHHARRGTSCAHRRTDKRTECVWTLLHCSCFIPRAGQWCLARSRPLPVMMARIVFSIVIVTAPCSFWRRLRHSYRRALARARPCPLGRLRRLVVVVDLALGPGHTESPSWRQRLRHILAPLENELMTDNLKGILRNCANSDTVIP